MKTRTDADDEALGKLAGNRPKRCTESRTLESPAFLDFIQRLRNNTLECDAGGTQGFAIFQLHAAGDDASGGGLVARSAIGALSDGVEFALSAWLFVDERVQTSTAADAAAPPIAVAIRVGEGGEALPALWLSADGALCGAVGGAVGGAVAGVDDGCGAPAMDRTAGAAPSAPMRVSRRRKSCATRKSRSRSMSRSPRFSPSSVSGAGASSRSFTRSREIRAWSAKFMRFSRRFGCLISSARDSSVSRSP